MRALLFLLVTACSSSPQPSPNPPSLDTLSGWLHEAGMTAERHGDILRVVHPAPWGPVGLTVQRFEEHHMVYLATQDFFSLEAAPDTPRAVLLLTNLATLNYETAEGKLQLNAETGEILLSLELPTDDGLGKNTFQAGITTLRTQAEALHPKLTRAITP